MTYSPNGAARGPGRTGQTHARALDEERSRGDRCTRNVELMGSHYRAGECCFRAAKRRPPVTLQLSTSTSRRRTPSHPPLMTDQRSGRGWRLPRFCAQLGHVLGHPICKISRDPASTGTACSALQGSKRKASTAVVPAGAETCASARSQPWVCAARALLASGWSRRHRSVATAPLPLREPSRAFAADSSSALKAAVARRARARVPQLAADSGCRAT
jgi:hypothetical protein